MRGCLEPQTEIMRSHCIVLERHPPLREAICSLRNKPTELETAKAYELGKAVHVNSLAERFDYRQQRFQRGCSSGLSS